MPKNEDQDIAQAKEMIMAASLTFKSKGETYERVAWLLEDIISEVDNLETLSLEPTSTSYEKVMNYLDDLNSEESVEQESKEVKQGI